MDFIDDQLDIFNLIFLRYSV